MTCDAKMKDSCHALAASIASHRTFPFDLAPIISCTLINQNPNAESKPGPWRPSKASQYMKFHIN